MLIDDRVTKGTLEPYRMFTSRAEHRLLFNHGSAELRLVEHARQHGLVSAARLARIDAKRARITAWRERFERERPPGQGSTWGDGVRRDRLGAAWPEGFAAEDRGVRENVLYQVAYQGYLEREERQWRRREHVERIRLPETLDYAGVRGLRLESVQKLAAARPLTLGQAGRISGVTPADISILLVWLEARSGRAGEGGQSAVDGSGSC